MIGDIISGDHRLIDQQILRVVVGAAQPIPPLKSENTTPHLASTFRPVGTDSSASLLYYISMKHSRPFTLSVIALVLLGTAACQPLAPRANTSKPRNGLTIQTAAKNAFGSLAAASASPATSRTSVTDSVTIGTVTPNLLIKPDVANAWSFVFTGTPLNLTDRTINVLERNIGVGLPMPTVLKTSTGLGTMNFSSAVNPLIENMTIRRGDELWNVNPIDGTISMYLATTTVYPMMKTLTAPNAVTDITQPVNLNTAPSAEDKATAISIASDFLTTHGIATSLYGQPILTSSPNYALVQGMLDSISARPVPAYSPQIQILYPLLIGGQAVVQSSGDPVGLTLLVDPTTKVVTSMYGLMTLDFTQSPYDALTDFTAVQKIAEQGGFPGYTSGPPNGQTTITLGTPERVLMSSYIYADNRSRETYVPALRFPVLHPLDIYVKSVVVPLAQDVPTNGPDGITAPSTSSGGGNAG